MQQIFIEIPLVLLIVALLFGVARLYRAAVFLVAWFILVEVVMVTALVLTIKTNDMFILMIGSIAGICMFLPSLWFATLFSFATSKPVRPAPVEKMYRAYDGLSERQKEKLHASAATAGAHLSEHLHRKGRSGLAGIVDLAIKLL